MTSWSDRPPRDEGTAQGPDDGRAGDPASLRMRDRELRLDLVARLTGAREALHRVRIKLAERGRADAVPKHLLDRIDRTLRTIRFAHYGVRNLFTQPTVLAPQVIRLAELDRTVLQDCSAAEEAVGQVSVALEAPHQLPSAVQRLERALSRFDTHFTQREAFIRGTG